MADKNAVAIPINQHQGAGEADGDRVVSGKQTLTLRRGDLVLVETCGGGGYGAATEREAERVETDCREGYVG